MEPSCLAPPTGLLFEHKRFLFRFFFCSQRNLPKCELLIAQGIKFIKGQCLVLLRIIGKLFHSGLEDGQNQMAVT